MIAPNFTEEAEAKAIARVEKLLEDRAGQHHYVAQAQREVLGRMLNLEIIEEELNRAQRWLDRVQGRDPDIRPIRTHKQYMDLLDEHDELRGREVW